MRWMTGLMILALTVVIAAPAAAQPRTERGDNPAAGPGGGARKQRVRMRLLQRRVGLDDATAQKVIQVLVSYEGKRVELKQRIQQRKQALGGLVRQDSNDERAYQQAIDDLVSVQREMEAIRLQEFEALRKVLTAKQQAKLLLELNRLIDRRQRRGAGGGRGPGMGPGGRGPGPR